MTRLSKVDSFKTVKDFSGVLDKANVQKKKFGGFTVTLNVNIDGRNKVIHVSRNQLAKLALKLAKSELTNPEAFSELKGKLSELDALGEGGGRGTKLKQAIGNLFFQLTHLGKDRAAALETADSKLKSKITSDVIEQAFQDLKLLADELKASEFTGPEKAADELEKRGQKVDAELRQPVSVPARKARKRKKAQ